MHPSQLSLPGVPAPVRFRPAADGDETPLAAIFNYYVEHTLAAFPERPVSVDAMHELLLQGASLAVLTVTVEDGPPEAPGGPATENVAGFGLLRPHSRFSTFDHAAEIAAFLAPERTGLGLGRALYDRLMDQARRLGVCRILACISALNPASLRFHAALGFRECGRFPGVMRKAGLEVDIVWMIKALDQDSGPA